jgi:hypothetical protein
MLFAPGLRIFSYRLSVYRPRLSAYCPLIPGEVSLDRESKILQVAIGETILAPNNLTDTEKFASGLSQIYIDWMGFGELRVLVSRCWTGKPLERAVAGIVLRHPLYVPFDSETFLPCL